MRVVERAESREACMEAGWMAFDYLLSEPIDREFVLSLSPLGSLLLMDGLKKPFFKIESDYRVIKGVLGNKVFRVGIHHEHLEGLGEVEGLIEG